jgi:hypothetical protein
MEAEHLAMDNQNLSSCAAQLNEQIRLLHKADVGIIVILYLPG